MGGGVFSAPPLSHLVAAFLVNPTVSSGREKVVVLVDDVENNDQTACNRIRLEQPLIPELAGLLVVFYKNEKPVCSIGAEECTSVAGSYQRNTVNESKKKIESIGTLMRSGQTINRRRLALIGLVILIIIVIIVLCAVLIR
ncbi:hypothetical protein GDO78_017905 [Eleutherodactylus coqui]|uniref:Uncharacterized protein n=1 Tax=Eleutherodactylus coqui TaxID=57060 RepID=A0A8J6EK42_ELECQ|nr:hypothetical protein GDO78_017905 [Eleutherodactylus coqui]